MLPDMERRSLKTAVLFCNSLSYDYSGVEIGKEYTYDELRSLIRDEMGGELPKRQGGKHGRDIQLEAWNIALDIEERGEKKGKRYFVKNRYAFTEKDKTNIANEIMQEYLLSQDNKSGVIYEIVLCLLYLRGRAVTNDKGICRAMEFSRSKWEVEIGLISRVFQKMLYNGDNVLTKTILGNILKVSVDEAKKNVFMRALEFIRKDKSIISSSNIKVLYIDTLAESSSSYEGSDGDDDKFMAGRSDKIKYRNKYYDYHTAYADSFLVEIIKLAEEEVMESMGFANQKQLVAAGKYLAFQNGVRAKLEELDGNSFFIKTGELPGEHKYKLLYYWKTYEIQMENKDLAERVKAIIKNTVFEDFTVPTDDAEVLSRPVVEAYVEELKKEINKYIEAKVTAKVDLEDFDFSSPEGKEVMEELAWMSYFSRYSQYRVYSEKEWEQFLFGSTWQTKEKDGVKFIYDNNDVIIGMIDENYNRINFSTGETLFDKSDDFKVLAELDKLAERIIGENESIEENKAAYSKKMNELIKSTILSENGELSEIGLDLEAMNNKIRELMEMQFMPQEDALSLAYSIIKNKKLLTRQLMMKLFDDDADDKKD